MNYTSAFQGMGAVDLLSLTEFEHSAATNCWAMAGEGWRQTNLTQHKKCRACCSM